MTNHHVALVTGANKGIGREVADQLGARGMTVLVGARDKRRGEHAATELRPAGRDAQFVEPDVTGTESVRAASVVVEEQFGRLDVLVNNTGIPLADPPVTSFGRPPRGPRGLRDERLRGRRGDRGDAAAPAPFTGAPQREHVEQSRFAYRHQHAGELPCCIAGRAGYAPSKTALNSMTVQYDKALRDEGILVNAADPGGCNTDFTRGMFAVSRSAAQGAAVAVRLATLHGDGPTGGYFDENGAVAW